MMMMMMIIIIIIIIIGAIGGFTVMSLNVHIFLKVTLFRLISSYRRF